MNYIAIIGDIKNSRIIENRGLIQDKLKQILSTINTCFENDIASKFSFTLGDEFQGLLKSGTNVLNIVKTIQNQMFPVQIRIGIGIGTIATNITYESTALIDGNAFYGAREQINMIHANERKLKEKCPDIQIIRYGETSLNIDMINSLLQSLRLIESEWSNQQRKTIIDMENNPETQADYAARNNINQSTIARRLFEGNYVFYKQLKEVISKSISQEMEEK